MIGRSDVGVAKALGRLSIIACLLMLTPLQARANPAVQPDTGTRLEPVDTSVGTLDRFEIGADSLQRGSFSLASGLHLPMERVAALADIFPRYSPEYGYSEWGRGWVSPAFALVRKGRHGPPKFDDHDAIESPWGLLWPGSGGHYPYGFQGELVVAQLAGDTVKVTLPDGTVWTYGGQGKTVVTPGRGVAVWMLSRIETVTGDSLTVDNYESSTSTPNTPTPGPPGRFFPSVITWHRFANRPITSPASDSGFFGAFKRLASSLFGSSASDAPDPVRDEVAVAMAKFTYDPVPFEHDDYSLGVLRELDRRVKTIEFAMRDRQADDFKTVATYGFEFESARPWYLSRISETRGGETHWTSYKYGQTWAESNGAPELETLPYGAVFSVAHVTNGPPGPASQLGGELAPADYDGDGVADFVARKDSWLVYAPDDNTYVPLYPALNNPQAVDECVGVRARPQVVYAAPGEKTPILAAISQNSPRELTLTECRVDGTLLDKRTLAVASPPNPGTTCAVADGLEVGPDGSVQAEFYDIDADGFTDLTMFDKCGLQIWKGTSPHQSSDRPALEFDGCTQSDKGTTCPSRSVVALELDPSSSHVVMDVNGDGLGDVVEQTSWNHVWMNGGMDASGLPQMLWGAGTFSGAGGLNGCLGLPPTFANVDGGDYADVVTVCPGATSLTVDLGSRRGLTTVTNASNPAIASVASVQAAPFGGTKNPGVALVGSGHKRGKNEACEAGTNPTTDTSDDGNTTYWCTPLVQWLTLRHPDTGLLTAVDDDRGVGLRFGYDWRPSYPGLPRWQPVLHEFHRATAGAQEVVQQFTYQTPWRDAESGVSGFADVVTRQWSSAAPDKQREIDRKYQVSGRLSALLTEADISPSGATIKKTAYDRSIAPMQGVPAVRLDRTVHLVSHVTNGLAPGEQLGFVQQRVEGITYDAARPLCPATVTVAGGQGVADKLVTTYSNYASPKNLGPAIACLAQQVETRGTHADASLDFDYLDATSYNDAGQVVAKARKHGDNSITLQTLGYRPEDGLLAWAQDDGRQKQLFTYEPASRSGPTVPATRMIRSVGGPEGVLTSATRSYDAVRDLLVQSDMVSGPRTLSTGSTYDDWGRLAGEWRSDAGGPSRPWHVSHYTSPRGGNRPGILDDTVVLDDSASRRSLTFFDAGGQAHASLVEKDDKAFEWNLTDARMDDVVRGTSDTYEGGAFIPRIAKVDELLYHEVPAFVSEPLVPGFKPVPIPGVHALSRSFDDDDLRGSWVEYIGPPIPGTGSTQAPAVLRQWDQEAQVLQSGRVVIRSHASTPGCDPQKAACSTLFVERTLDGFGREVVRNDADGRVTTTDYDMLGRARRIHLPWGEIQAHDYDDFGRLSRVKRDGFTVQYGYAGTVVSNVETSTSDASSSVDDRVAVTPTVFGTPKVELFESGDCHAATPHSCRRDQLIWQFDEGDGGTETSPIATGVRGRGFERRSDRGVEVLNREELRLSAHYDPGSPGTYNEAPWRRVVRTYQRFADESVQAVTTDVFRGNDAEAAWHLEQKMVLDAAGRPSEVWIDGIRFLTIKYMDTPGDQNGNTYFSFPDGHTVIFAHADPLRGVDTLIAAEPSTPKPSGQSAGSWVEIDRKDVDGRTSWRANSDGVAAPNLTFGYVGGQLTSVTPVKPVGAAAVESYRYDAKGLLASTTLPSGASASITRDSTHVGVQDGPTWSLDALGRPISEGTKTLVWGPRGQIDRVDEVAGTSPMTTDFFYDENDHRLLADTKVGGQEVLVATVDNLVVTEGEIRYDFIVDGHVFGTFVGDAKTFHAADYDRLNTLRALDSQHETNATVYGARADRSELALLPEFVGRRFDAHTGMVRIGVRDYIPELGQFAAPDRLYLGSAALCQTDPVGCNLFSYVHGDPVNGADATGLLEEDLPECREYGGCGETINVTVVVPPAPGPDSSRSVEAPGGTGGGGRPGYLPGADPRNPGATNTAAYWHAMGNLGNFAAMFVSLFAIPFSAPASVTLDLSAANDALLAASTTAPTIEVEFSAGVVGNVQTTTSAAHQALNEAVATEGATWESTNIVLQNRTWGTALGEKAVGVLRNRPDTLVLGEEGITAIEVISPSNSIPQMMRNSLKAMLAAGEEAEGTFFVWPRAGTPGL